MRRLVPEDEPQGKKEADDKTHALGCKSTTAQTLEAFPKIWCIQRGQQWHRRLRVLNKY
jgi:ribosomal protein L27